MIIIQTTLRTQEKAAEIGMALLQNRLIACYNFFPITSGYWWEEKIEQENEILLLMKTREEHLAKIEIFIKEHSGYEVPEVIAFKPENINLPYLRWVEEATDR